MENEPKGEVVQIWTNPNEPKGRGRFGASLSFGEPMEPKSNPSCESFHREKNPAAKTGQKTERLSDPQEFPLQVLLFGVMFVCRGVS